MTDQQQQPSNPKDPATMTKPLHAYLVPIDPKVGDEVTYLGQLEDPAPTTPPLKLKIRTGVDGGDAA